MLYVHWRDLRRHNKGHAVRGGFVRDRARAEESPRHSKRMNAEKGWYSEWMNHSDFAVNRTNAFDEDLVNILPFTPAEYRT